MAYTEHDALELLAKVTFKAKRHVLTESDPVLLRADLQRLIVVALDYLASQGLTECPSCGAPPYTR